MNIKSAFIYSCFFTFSLSVSGQTINWYEEDNTPQSPQNLGTDQVYQKILKNKTGSPVVVAVIDSGIDIEHEDLDDVIWTNPSEIPDNGIDDDNNGYIDDIHGWNFIGSKDGRQVGGDTFEMVREYAKLRKKYNHIEDPSRLTKKELEEFNQFNEWGNKIEQEAAGAKAQYDELAATHQLLDEALSVLENVQNWNSIDEFFIDSLGGLGDQNSAIAANILNYYLKESPIIVPYDELREEVLGPIQEGLDHFEPRFKFNYNPDFNSREIVGDNYNDPLERYYGNNLVEGPDAFHGTHVAGIIAAERNNGIGINGIAQNVKIMVIRAVPDGDERDKDVANAIRYAVENGASIINMSFGKGMSPEKQVVDDAVRFAEKNDVLIVHAAGNSNMNIDGGSENYPNDHYIKPKGFLFWKKKQPKNWISVGASGPIFDESLAASFSNYGKEDVDVFAPGENMLSSTPDNNYEIAQGTSMAAPVIAGVAAVLRSYYPTLTAEQVKQAIVESTSSIDKLVVKPGTDELVPFSELSKSGGVINLSAAIQAASKIKGKRKKSKSKAIRA